MIQSNSGLSNWSLVFRYPDYNFIRIFRLSHTFYMTIVSVIEEYEGVLKSFRTESIMK
jgi:hypothetical protein